MGAGWGEIGRSLELARDLDDAQTLVPALVGAARLARRHRLTGGGAELDQALTLLADNESVGDPQDWHVELVHALVESGRGDAADALVERMPAVPWRDVCAALVVRDYVGAADRLAAIGAVSLEADVRLDAARALGADGRHAEEERQLELARAFYRSVGATEYVREADEILAAAS